MIIMAVVVIVMIMTMIMIIMRVAMPAIRDRVDILRNHDDRRLRA